MKNVEMLILIYLNSNRTSEHNDTFKGYSTKQIQKGLLLHHAMPINLSDLTITLDKLCINSSITNCVPSVDCNETKFYYIAHKEQEILRYGKLYTIIEWLKNPENIWKIIIPKVKVEFNTTVFMFHEVDNLGNFRNGFIISFWN